MAYITQSDLENRFGTVNIARWSNLAGGESADATRIAAAIAYGEGYVENRFRRSRYTVPFSATGGSHDVLLVDWMAIYAGDWLYSSRMIRARDDDPNRTAVLTERAAEQIDSCLAGQMRIAEAEEHADTPGGPTTILF